MKKLSYLIFLAFSCLATSCNAKSEKEIDINLSSVFGYYDSYSDTEKTLTILNGTTVSSLPKPQPIFPEVYTFKGYGLNRTNDSILPNDYVVKNNETLYAKFDRELKSNETFIFYDASSVTKEEPEKNIIGIQAGLLKEEGIEQNFKIECSDPNCNFYFEIEDLKKSILSFGIIIDENYCGPVVFKITCPMNFMALCEVKGELSSDKIDQKIFINGNEFVRAICFNKESYNLSAPGNAGHFSCLKNLQFVDFDGEKTTIIPGYTFYQCSNLKYLPSMPNLTEISIKSFSECSSLQYFDLPKKMKSFDIESFSHCTSLENIKIPSLSKDKGKSTFKGCSNLKNIDFSDSNILFEGMFENCNSLKEIHISNSVGLINTYAFRNCINLENVTFETGSTSLTLATKIFYGCQKIKTLKLPRHVYQLPSDLLEGTSINTLDLSSADFKYNYVYLGSDNPVANKKGKIIVKQDLLESYKNDSLWQDLKDSFVAA